ncbi:hypothetical protein EXY23_26240 [Roseicella aquatilis]|uniref:Transposase n=1 Tax=Roseicella aquatilis TaxID=2527868 RepID=A0A4V2WJE7_9PROT|nr:hypothetical protein EXY23_26240 [Roseicella aquatilis]
MTHVRCCYAGFVADERPETLLACHEHAVLAFGGVPREVLYDNMRTVVVDRSSPGPRRAQTAVSQNRAAVTIRARPTRPRANRPDRRSPVTSQSAPAASASASDQISCGWVLGRRPRQFRAKASGPGHCYGGRQLGLARQIRARPAD